MNTAYTTCDKNIREALLKLLERSYKNGTCIKPEFNLENGKSRIDIAVIGKELHGFELKGDLDNLQRLEYQRDIYNTVFDRITLVVGKSHAIESLKLIPEWWGLTLATKSSTSNTVTLIQVRKAMKNPQINTYALAQMLLKDEILNILRKSQLTEYSLTNKPKEYLCKILAEQLNQYELKTQVRTYLNTRITTQQFFPAF